MSVDSRSSGQRKAPKQERSREMVAKIVHATAALLRRVEPDRITTNLIAEKADVSKGSIYQYFANKDDPRWKDKETAGWIRDHFWEIHTGDPKTGYSFRIPKPHTVGLLFGSMVERILDAYFGDNPNAFKDAQWTIFSALAPNFVPTVAQPILEQWANRSFFTGQNLVPADLERGLPEYQYSEYTTELSKLVGRLVGSVPGMHESQAASPMVLDNYVRNWTGTLGVYAWQITDKVLREAAASDTALGRKLRELKVEDPPKPALTLADIDAHAPSIDLEAFIGFYAPYRDAMLSNADRAALARADSSCAFCDSQRALSMWALSACTISTSEAYTPCWPPVCSKS